jgi:hypothetical protein
MKLITFLLTTIVALSLTSLSGQAAEKTGKLFHVVSFKFKESATPEQIKAVDTAFRDLKNKITEIKTLDAGTNVSPEKLNKGFTHAWVLSFTSDKDRDAYLVHPAHKAFGSSLNPVLADVFVIDFWSEK